MHKASAALIAIILPSIVPLPGAAHAAACVKDGQAVTVSGTIELRRLADAKAYPVIAFDKPICVKDAAEAAASIVFVGAEPKFKDRQHASLHGILAQRSNDSQPPGTLILTVVNKPADIPQKEEKVISGKDDPVAGRCADNARKFAAVLGDSILRVVVTRNPRWGTVWRADTSHPGKGEAPTLWRIVCWKDSSAVRPLQMFDKTKNIPPL